jgi:hypothetical protein
LVRDTKIRKRHKNWEETQKLERDTKIGERYKN